MILPKFTFFIMGIVVLMIMGCNSRDPHSSSIARYVSEAAAVPAKPLLEESIPVFINYQPYLYSLEPGISPFGILQVRQNTVPLLQSFPLSQIKMVGMIYFQKEAWGLVSLPNGMMERIKVGTSLGEEGGKVVAVSINKIVVEDSLASSFKKNTGGSAAGVRRTELHLR